MKSLQLFWKKLAVVLLAAAMTFSALLPAVQAEAAENADLSAAEPETAETISAEPEETAENSTAEPEETAESSMAEPEETPETILAKPEENAAAENTDSAETENAEQKNTESGDRELTPVSSAAQADELVEFSFLTPATKIILDGEPLMILPDTLTAHLEYYDTSGNIVDREIRYTSDALETGASWSAMQYFLGTGSGALDPLYDAGTGGWYYMIRGSRYDVPVQEIRMSDSDALELEYAEDYWGVGDEWPQGKVRLYKVMSNEALIWDDLYMNQTPADSAYISRGSALGSACTFSTNDPLDGISHYTLKGETYYYANFYYGTKDRLLVDCRPSCTIGYANVIDEVGTDIYLIEKSASSTPFTAYAKVEEEGWYRLDFTNYGLPSSAEITITFSSEIENEIFQTAGAARNYLANRTEPVYLKKGYCMVEGDIRINSAQSFYDGATLHTTLKKLESGDILTKNLGLQQYGDHRKPWSWKSDGREFDYGYEGLYFAPEKWPDYDGEMPNPASLTGRVSGDCLMFKYGSYMYTSKTGEREYYPFSFCTQLPLSEMELTGTDLLTYSLSDFGQITAQLLDPNGNAMDLTSTEELAGGKYTFQMISKTGDTVMEEQNIPIWIPQKTSSKIVSAEDFSISYDETPDYAAVTRVFRQSEDDPDEYFLDISRKYDEIYGSTDLLNRLSILVSFEEYETVFSGETFIDGMTIGSNMKEWTFDWAKGYAYDADDVSPLYMAGLVSSYSKQDSDYLELHFYNQTTGEEISDWWNTEIENGEYLLTVTSGINHFEKKVHISVTGGPVMVESIHLSDTEITLRPEKWHHLTYELVPANTDYPEVSWESSDESIAYVEPDGTIYARKPGDATITISAQNGAVTATCLVHVRKQGIEKLTLSETEVTLHPGETLQLDYELIPEDNDYPDVWWSVQDKKVAFVENGLIEAVGAGDTTVTLHAQDGEVTANCTVHVVPHRVESIILEDFAGNEISDGGTAEVCVGDDGGVRLIYLSDTDPAFQLGEDDVKDLQINVSNSNQTVVKISKMDNCSLFINALKQGSSILTVTIKGDGWEKIAKFNIFVQFQDVTQKSKYYYAPVYWAARKGITNGYGGWEFGVGWNCTREDMVTFLWRMQGKPSVTAAEKKKYHFPDVVSGSYYENAVVWAAKNGITKGYSSGEYKGQFGVGLDVTREEAVTFLYRVAGKPAVSAADLKQHTFKDIKSTAYYAKPVAWAAKNNITKGYSSGAYAGKFGVGLKVTREDIVTFMYRNTGGK